MQRGADVRTVASDYRGRFDPREILRSLGVMGIKSILLEGGADTARRFIDAGVVDRIALFVGQTVVGEGGIPSPVFESAVPVGFRISDQRRFAGDRLIEFERID